MRKLKIRQGAIGGMVVSIVGAAAAAARSADPFPTFAYFLAVALSMTALAIAAIVAIDRRRSPPPGAR